MKTVVARLLTCGIALTLSSAVPEPVHAQGTRADYERAERFLPWNIKKLVSEADVTPHWIAGSSRFWYEKKTADEKEFRLVASSRNVLGPAFNHARLAEVLSRAAHRAYDARHLPFDSFEFLEKETAIELTVEKQRWRCSLGAYSCARKDEGDPWATPSPDGRWAAFVRDYDLYLRNLSSGQEVRLTADGERRRDYATPLPSL